MISKPNTIHTYFKAHPIKSVVLSVFTLFTILGAGFGTFAIVAPDNADALITGGPGCCGGWGGWDPFPGFPNPIMDPDPFPGGSGGGSIIPSCTLSVVPGSVNEGDPVSITWTTVNAVAANIDGEIGPVNSTNGSINRTPLVDTTYTMTVVSATGHTATCSDDVVVIPPVDTTPTCSFSIASSVVNEGESTTINWTTTNATNVSISPVRWGGGGTNLAPNGSQTITPEESTTYTLTASDADGDTVTCSDTVTVNPITVPAPVCTLSISPESITLGQSATISWETRNADDFSIDNGVGNIALITEPIADGTVSITPGSVGTFTYTGTAENSFGDTVTCSDTIVVNPVDVDAPVCTLTAGSTVLAPGETTTLTWTTDNAILATLNGNSVALDGTQNNVGAGTYTLIAANGDGETATCTETITVTTPSAPICTLEAGSTVLAPGETTTLTWTSTNAVSAELDGTSVDLNGSQSGVGAGTYTFIAENAVGETATCTETITVTTPGDLACTLDIDRDAMRSGETAEMTWTTTDAVSFSINGNDKDLDGSETIRPTAIREHVYTGTATDADGNTVTCSDKIKVEGGTGGSNLECSLMLTRSVIKPGETSELRWETREAESVEIDRGIGEVAFIGSQEVRPTGTGRYEYVLTARGNGDQVSCRAELIVEGGSGCSGDCGGVSSPRITIDLLRPPGEQPFAFVTLSQIPYTGIELGPMGTIIYWIFLIVWSGAVAYLTLFKIFPFLGRKMLALGTEAQYVVDDVKEGTMEAMETKHTDVHVEDGFHPEPSNEESLSIEDIVRGLSRKQESAPVVEEEEETFDTDVITEMSQPPVAEPTSGDDIRFLNALMQGDRDTTFGILRRSVRNGQRPEVVLEGVIVHLDSAYRARVEGAPCSEDVRRACSACDTGLLEEVIAALTSAIDTTYSHAGTGAKLALTRAHAIVDRG